MDAEQYQKLLGKKYKAIERLASRVSENYSKSYCTDQIVVSPDNAKKVKKLPSLKILRAVNKLYRDFNTRFSSKGKERAR